MPNARPSLSKTARLLECVQLAGQEDTRHYKSSVVKERAEQPSRALSDSPSRSSSYLSSSSVLRNEDANPIIEPLRCGQPSAQN